MLEDIAKMSEDEVLEIVKNNLPDGIRIHWGNIENKGSGVYEIYVGSGRRVDGEDADDYAEMLSKSIGISVDSKITDRTHDFYLLIGSTYDELRLREESQATVQTIDPIEKTTPQKEYVDFFKEEVVIKGDAEFLKNEVAPLLDQLGYKRAKHYSWDFRFDAIFIRSMKGSLEWEKGTYISDITPPPQYRFGKTREISIEEIKMLLEDSVERLAEPSHKNDVFGLKEAVDEVNEMAENSQGMKL